MGSCLTNKYAEGYPGKRYYGGCEVVDKVETLARERAKGPVRRRIRQRAASLRRAGQRAAVYQALVKPGDTILGLALDHGGHLTGMRINFSGRFYKAESYGVNPETFASTPRSSGSAPWRRIPH